jgi:hypothetical protein
LVEAEIYSLKSSIQLPEMRKVVWEMEGRKRVTGFDQCTLYACMEISHGSLFIINMC